MEGVFWNVIRRQIVEMIEQKPSRECLLILLKIGDPPITDADVDDETKRSSAFRKLKLLIHPDKHPNDGKCTKLFQDVQSFYESSIKELHRRPKTKPKCSHSPSSFPSSFHVEEKWPWLSECGHQPIVSAVNSVSTKRLQRVTAYKCINFRGAIAHGKKTQCAFTFDNVRKSKAKTAEEVFQAWGGSKCLESIEEIKEEISTNGPVVSSSFRLSKAFLNAGEHRSQFEPKLANNGSHALLLVGWKVSQWGEMWLVRSFVGITDIHIPIGQYAIEENVVGPTNDFSNEPWQEDDAFVDVSFKGVADDWYNWSKCRFYLSHTELATFFRTMNMSMSTIIFEKKKFLCRDKDKKARSRQAYMEDLEWKEDNQKWCISSKFCD